MSDSNRVAVRIVEELVPGVTPANPKFQAQRITSASALGFTPETIESEELRDDAQVSDLIFVGGEAGGELPFEVAHESQDSWLPGLLRSAYQKREERRNDRGATQITAVDGDGDAFTITNTVTTGSITVDFAASGSSITRASGSFLADGFAPGMAVLVSGAEDVGNNDVFILATVSALVMTVYGTLSDETGDTGVTISQVFAEGDIVRAEGFNSANDGFHVVDSGATATSVPVASDLVDQDPVPSTATLHKVGVVCPADDVDATAAVSGVASLTSSTFDFRTLALEPGDSLKLRGFDGNPANDAFVRVKSIAENLLEIDHLPAGWDADQPSGSVELYVGVRLKNGTTKRAYSVEEEFGDHDPVTFNYTRGMQPGTATLFGGGAAEVVTGTVTFLGRDQEYTDANTTPKTATAKRPALAEATGRITGAVTLGAGTHPVMNTSSDVARIGRGGAAIDGVNLVLEATLEIENNLRPKRAWGVVGAADVGMGRFSASGTLNTYFDDRTIVESITKNEETSLDFLFTDSAQHALAYDLPRVKYREGTPDVPGVDTDSVANLTYQALVHRVLGYTLKVTKFHGVR